MSVRVFLEEISIWVSRPSKEICSHQCGQPLSYKLGAWKEQKVKERWRLSFFLRWDIGFFLPLGIRALGSWVFRLQDLYQWLPGSWVFGFRLNYTNGLSGSPTCRWKIMELLAFHNCEPIPIICLPLYLSIFLYVYPTGSVSLENPNTIYITKNKIFFMFCFIVYGFRLYI